MIRKADTLGTFQIESRAQMSMLPRMKPRTFYDLVIEVAIVRPGRSRATWCIRICDVGRARRRSFIRNRNLRRFWARRSGCRCSRNRRCGSPSNAPALHRARPISCDGRWRPSSSPAAFRSSDKLIDGMVARGYEREFAEKTFSRLEGFGSYGFPESHAASFALIAYASSWMKCWHPDVFCAALLNAQPMGFYAPAQIVRDARDHGVEIRPVCVNASRWDCTLEPAARIALPYDLVCGWFAASPTRTVLPLWRSGPRCHSRRLTIFGDGQRSRASLVELADADAMKRR